MAGPEDPAAAGHDRLRAGHADREQAIDTLKNAFVQGRLTSDELDARTGRALAARTYADLAALTADIPAAQAAASPLAAGPARTPAPARRRPMATAAAGSGICLIIAAAAIWVAFLVDPDGPGPNPYHSWAPPMLLLAYCAMVTALGFMVHGVVTSLEQRHSRGQLPPRPGPGGHALAGERRDGTGQDPVPHVRPADQTGAELRVHQSRQHRRQIPARAGRVLRDVRPTPGAA